MTDEPKQRKVMECYCCAATTECSNYQANALDADQSDDWFCDLCANTLSDDIKRSVNYVGNQILQAMKGLDLKLDDVLQSIHHVMGGGDTNG